MGPESQTAACTHKSRAELIKEPRSASYAKRGVLEMAFGERKHRSGYPGVPVRGHIGNNYLLGDCVPKIVNAQATPGIARITTILDVPVHGVRLPLPRYPKLVGSTE